MVPVFLEFFIRTIYYNIPYLRKYRDKKRRRKRQRYVKAIFTRSDLEVALRQLGIKRGDSILVHSSVDGLRQLKMSPLEILKFLFDFIGEGGNILMPTHPVCSNKYGRLVYDVQRSPSSVGLLPELFRRMPDVKRSKHPISTIAVWGADAEFFLRDNINENFPLPHGIYSPYWRLVEKKGRVISLGAALEYSAPVHIAEDVLDDNFPIKNFFEKINCIIVDKGKSCYATVRQRRSCFVRYLALSRLKSDYKKHNLVQTYQMGKMRLYSIDVSNFVSWMMQEAYKGYTIYPLAKKK